MTTHLAGEHSCFAQLYRLGWQLAFPAPGNDGWDVIAVGNNGLRRLVEVKTRTARGTGWPMRKAHAEKVADDLFYVFVDYSDQYQPASYVIPSSIVADLLARSHAHWLANSPAGGRRRNDSNLRRMHFDYSHRGIPERPAGWIEEFRTAWHLLGNPLAPNLGN